MQRFVSMLVAAAAVAASPALAQLVDLTGPYQCVQACRGDPGGRGFITQNGSDMNLVNEAGQPSRAWFDRPDRIWVRSYDEGATVSPDGLTIWFDRGTVWQRDLGGPAGPTVVRRAVPPPPPVAAAPPARAAVPNPYDGAWSVAITTRSGACDPEYRFGVQIINGAVVPDGASQASLQGQVERNGAVWVTIAGAGNQASGQGRLLASTGGGSWQGQGPGGSCAGTWQAVRRG
ncbi:MAG: hypothetical protein ACJ8F3_17565 [Xanthobacteraceae bacterium]